MPAISRERPDIAAVLMTYQDERYLRTARVQITSRYYGDLYHAAGVVRELAWDRGRYLVVVDNVTVAASRFRPAGAAASTCSAKPAASCPSRLSTRKAARAYGPRSQNASSM